MRVAIIGAGPAGLAAGEVLSRRDVQVEVFEASDTVGGMARSFALWGQTVDLGPHRFFSQDPTVNQFWLDVVGADVRMVDRLTRIFYRDRFFRYPLEARNALWNLGAFEARGASAATWPRRPLRAYRTGSKGRSRAGWSSASVAACSRSSSRRTARSSGASPAATSTPISPLSASRSFPWPRRSGRPWDSAAACTRRLSIASPIRPAARAWSTNGWPRIRERGGRVETRRPVRGLVHDHGVVRGLHFANGETRCFDHVISTMPLTQLVWGLGPLPALVAGAVEQLRFRNTILVYLNVDARDLFPDQWLYVHSPELRTGRVTNFRNWVPELYGESPTSILALEYWCDDEDPLWTESEECLLGRAAREIRSTGLIGSAAILDGKIVRVHRSYPVYRAGYRATWTGSSPI